MSLLETSIPALCAWREARGGGIAGMQAVINVLQNRALRNKTTLYVEATKYEQFTSISPPKGMTAEQSEADVWPQPINSIDWLGYGQAEFMVNKAMLGTLQDLTNGATMYYATSMKEPPPWDFTKLEATVTIADQHFFRVIA
jgi:Cell Wall Hydrolase